MPNEDLYWESVRESLEEPEPDDDSYTEYKEHEWEEEDER